MLVTLWGQSIIHRNRNNMTKLDVALFWMSSRCTVVMLCKSLVKKLINRKKKKKQEITNVLKNPFITKDLFHLAFSLFWPYNKALLALIEISQWHTSLSNTYKAKHHCNGSFLHSSPAFQLPYC